MRKLLLAIVIGLVLPGLAQAGWVVKRKDCTSVQDYLSSNTRVLGALASALVPKAEPVPVDGPAVKGDVTVDHVGVTASFLGGLVDVGVSPGEIVNFVTGLFCLQVWESDTPTGAPDAPPPVP